MSEDHTEFSLVQLQQAVRAAALPADQQLQCFPSNCDVTFEIADDFANWCRWALAGYMAPALTNQQRSSLLALEARLNRMSGQHNAALWTDDALRSHPEWAAVREEAQQTLMAFGWPLSE